MAVMSHGTRRELFLDAAMEVIRREGLNKTTTRRIAAQADAPLGSLHYCFRNKDEVIEGVLRALHESGRNRLALSVSDGMGVSAAASAILRAFAAWVEETIHDQLTEYELQIWVIRSGRQADLSSVLYGYWIETVVELLARAEGADEPRRDLNALTRLLFALTDGLNLQDRLTQEDEMAAMTERAIVVLIRAIEAGDFDIEPRTDAR
jgi:TetR/AcrR family transcriptional regulator, regulator of biofilm formation and stress response